MPQKDEHARYSPSSIERVIACPGSVRLSENCENRDSAASREGTDAHECLELLLKNGEQKSVSSLKFLLANHPPEMIEHVHSCAGEVWARGGEGKTIESEKRVFLDHIDKDLWGTLDVAIIEHFGVLEIIDFKYGKFISVEAKHNPQLMTYAAGEANRHDYNFEKVKITIMQPRAPHEDGPTRSWDLPMEGLHQWEAQLRFAIGLTKKRDAPLKPGSHCFFCPAKLSCKAYDKSVTKRVQAQIVDEKRKLVAEDRSSARIKELFG